MTEYVAKMWHIISLVPIIFGFKHEMGALKFTITELRESSFVVLYEL